MTDKTTGRVSVEVAKRRNARHKQQMLRNLKHQIEMMKECTIPDKEDELLQMRDELTANQERVEELRLEIEEAENG